MFCSVHIVRPFVSLQLSFHIISQSLPFYILREQHASIFAHTHTHTHSHVCTYMLYTHTCDTHTHTHTITDIFISHTETKEADPDYLSEPQK